MVATRGRLKLHPIEGSVGTDTIDLEVDLARSDGMLTFGDLRRAAELFEAHGHHEIAHRLWHAVERAAHELDDHSWADEAADRSREAVDRAGAEVSRAFRTSGVKFDYLAIAAARREGLAASAVATEHGCSISTVARAVEFAEQRASLLDNHPSFVDRLVPGADPVPLAAYYGVDPNVMRWTIAVAQDRRRR